ncbi:unnamed protein product [Aureobasidium uvarum]|uniref:Uncharacterized protein n=1 Tax=Aureobasidium uvarum TaxID=2773716 RepID=A0A9N8KXJ8_9PEZI|nr:unnamed protein product [Aureobasidium uvarum]
MRPHIIALRVFVLALQWAHLALTENDAERSPLCKKIEDEGHELTAEQASSIVGPWAQAQFDEWKSVDSRGHFWTWLHRKWAPDAADSIINCKLSSKCSPVTCRFIDDQQDIEDQWSAFWTLEMVTNLHNMAWEIRNSNQEAWLSVRGDLATIMGKFSDGSNIEKHKAQHDRHWKIASHIITTVAMLLSAIGVWLSAGAGVGIISAEAAVGAAAEAAGTAAPAKLLGTLTVEQVRMISSSAGLFGTTGTAALNFGTDMIEAKNYVSKTTSMLEHSQKMNQDRIVDRFDSYLMSLFAGDQSLIDMIQQGRYTNSTSVHTPNINTALRQQWAASYISSIWNVERTYIVMANTRNCEADSRGFKGLRVCLEEAPKYVFYAFSKSIVREGTNHKALIRGPIGHKELKSFTGFTLKDAVRASYVYSMRHGYSAKQGAPESEDMLDSFYGPKSIEAGGRAHGLFNIPILYSPGGQAISSINSRHNRNYPCMAAALPWSTEHHNRDSSLEARNSGSEKWADNDPKTMFQFLNVTGFYKSGDWWSYCTCSRKHHGNHCRGNKKINWEGKFGPDQYKKIHHPFKECKGRKHDFVGCERPNNNGYDKNKCGGKHNIALGLAEGDVQGYNETAFDLEGMSDDAADPGDSEDEGDQSDWTDGEDESDDEEEGDDSELPASQENKTTNVAPSRA